MSGNSVLEAEGNEEGEARFVEVGEISSALTRREGKLTGILDSFTRQRTTWGFRETFLYRTPGSYALKPQAGRPLPQKRIE